MKEMTGRERVLASLAKRTPDRIPREILLEPGVAKRLAKVFGTSDLNHATRTDIVYARPAKTRLQNIIQVIFHVWMFPEMNGGVDVGGDSEMHYAEYLYPLENAETVDEIVRYPWPDLSASYRVEGVERKVAGLHDQGFAVYGDVSETFEIAWQLRSMERLFDDMLHDSEMAMVKLDHIVDRNVALAKVYALAGVDILYTGDDVAMQNGLMMSRRFWHDWLGPRLKQVIQSARQVNPNIHVQYHCDGKINDLIPDLIEAGIAILNPVQPECVDHHWVKKTFGDCLAFNGGLGVQSILPFGTYSY